MLPPALGARPAGQKARKLYLKKIPIRKAFYLLVRLVKDVSFEKYSVHQVDNGDINMSFLDISVL